MLENWYWVIGFELRWAKYTSLFIWLDINENCFNKLNNTTLSEVYGNITEYMGKGGGQVCWNAHDSEIVKTLQTLFVYFASIFRYTGLQKFVLIIVSALSKLRWYHTGKLIFRGASCLNLDHWNREIASATSFFIPLICCALIWILNWLFSWLKNEVTTLPFCFVFLMFFDCEPMLSDLCIT